MTTKSAHPNTPEGPITRGKGLDTLDRFIIQNWAPYARFGVWHGQSGALCPPKVPLDHFLNDALRNGWLRDGGGAVITIDPTGDPFVTIRVENENHLWSPDLKYNPKHWIWKVVPVASALGVLDAVLAQAGPEAGYLQGLRDGRLKEAWDALPRP